jgi:hypothetical protein
MDKETIIIYSYVNPNYDEISHWSLLQVFIGFLFQVFIDSCPISTYMPFLATFTLPFIGIGDQSSSIGTGDQSAVISSRHLHPQASSILPPTIIPSSASVKSALSTLLLIGHSNFPINDELSLTILTQTQKWCQQMPPNFGV